MCERELGLVLDKSSQTSDWIRRSLDADQLKYAALDTQRLLALHQRFDALKRAEHWRASPGFRREG